jgi:hypothetical protein
LTKLRHHEEYKRILSNNNLKSGLSNTIEVGRLIEIGRRIEINRPLKVNKLDLRLYNKDAIATCFRNKSYIKGSH